MTKTRASRAWTALAWLTAAVPVAGWIIAQTLTERIGHVSEFTSALVHQTSVSTFAVILAVSAVVNAIIVPIAVFALVPLHHSNCAVTGSGITSSGAESTHKVFTTCGDFVYDPATLSEDELRYSAVPLDITTQGFQVFPPALRLVSFEEGE